MAWLDHKAELHRMFPTLFISSKNHLVWKILAVFSWIITFGKINRKAFIEDFFTALGPFVGIPENASFAAVKDILIHEEGHADQSSWFWYLTVAGVLVMLFYSTGLGTYLDTKPLYVSILVSAVISIVVVVPIAYLGLRVWPKLFPLLGFPVFAIVYGLLVLPVGLAIFRVMFEIDADKRLWTHYYTLGLSREFIVGRAKRFGNTVAYRYAYPLFYPKWVVSWFTKSAEKHFDKLEGFGK